MKVTARLTGLAWMVLVIVVVSRATMTEEVREPFAARPGAVAFPRSAGAAVSLMLDLACFLPGILILLRRALDREYSIRWNWSHAIGAALAIWVICSIAWSDDRFLATIHAANWAGAMALLWAASQLVRNWQTLRVMAAVCYGLLLVNLVQAVYYELVDLPDVQKQYFDPKYHADFLKSQGWTADSYAAHQYDVKIQNGEVMGFTNSSNSLASVIVLLMGIGAGLIIQRLADRDREAIGWAAVMGVAYPVAIWVLVLTNSKAAAVMPVLIGGILLAIWACRGSMATKPAAWFWGGAGVVAGVMGIAIIYGLHTGRLPTDSLKFRWRYWVAAWGMFWQRPILGCGWANFGLHYDQFRVSAAAEDIQDPHNFLIRFFVETGVIGGILVGAAVLRIWWEWTRPVEPSEEGGGRGNVIAWLAIVAGCAMVVNSAASIDWSQPGAYLATQVLTRCLYGLALLVGAAVAAMRSMASNTADDRRAPWVLWAILASLGVFLIHNLIEFSMFETGATMLFALVAGSALGARLPEKLPSAGGAALARVGLGAAVLAWGAVALGVVVPVIQGESAAQAADDALRQGNIAAAAEGYLNASNLVPFNADYRFRYATTLLDSPTADLRTIRRQIDLAIAENPSSIQFYLTRGSLDQTMGDVDQMKQDFQHALELNPGDVDIRLQYSAALKRAGDFAAAMEQYQEAVRRNNLLPADEPRRLTDEQLQARKP